MTNYEPTAFAKEVCARLRGLIAQYDLNQSDLAVLCDVSQSQFSKIIRGARPMTVDQLAALCDALDVGLVEFIGDVEDFVSDRCLVASPIRLVEDGERLSYPAQWPHEHLDKWALNASGRGAAARAIALAASDDADWQRSEEIGMDEP